MVSAADSRVGAQNSSCLYYDAGGGGCGVGGEERSQNCKFLLRLLGNLVSERVRHGWSDAIGSLIRGG